MSYNNQSEATVEAEKGPKVVQRCRQHETTPIEPPVRRSWRPCQMLNQDGELHPHHRHHQHHLSNHHHHSATGHGLPRHRWQHLSGPAQGQGHVQGTGPISELVPLTQSPDTTPRSVQHLRPAVTRYRRHGDPNPRLRGHRKRQVSTETQDTLPGAEGREDPTEVLVLHNLSDDTIKDQLQGSPHQTPIAVVTPTHLSPETTNQKRQHISPADTEHDTQEWNVECEEKSLDVKEEEKELQKAEDNGDHFSNTASSPCSHGNMQTVNNGGDTEMLAQCQGEVMDGVATQGSDVTDLCSDTESTASLSMDRPLHSPPPLQSPSPSSSPEVPNIPHLDHFIEDADISPVPDNDLLPDHVADFSESCSPSHSASCSKYYPKTYADFYIESHQKSYPEIDELYSEPKSPHASFPEAHKESCGLVCQTTESKAVQRESITSQRQGNVHVEVLSALTDGTHPVPRPGQDRASHRSPLDCSVGSRLHHYDGQSDGEGDRPDQTPLPKICQQTLTQADSRAKSSSSAKIGEAQNVLGLTGEGSLNISGDTISLAIKDIKEAIEEVKTKTVRSPYTADQPVEPVWVMRQELSPTDDTPPLQEISGHSTPPSASESLSRYASVPAPPPVSASESSGAILSQHHHQKQHNHHGHQAHQSQQSTRRQFDTPLTHTPPQQDQNNHQTQQMLQHQLQQPSPHAKQQQPSIPEIHRSLPQFPTFVDVPGPCDPEDLIDGIIFAATYLGCTHLLSERTPTKSARMQQAQEAMNRVRAAQKQTRNRKKSPDGEAPSTAEVDLFMSTQRIKVLNADTQETIMDLPLRTISYIADIGNMVVLMARGRMIRSRSALENLDYTSEERTARLDTDQRLYRMICHVFESEDAQLIAQSIGQSFSVAYQEFLRANGIDPDDLSQREYSDLLNTQDMYNDDLIHFSKSENCRDVYIEKQKGEILGVVIVESGWGSILPTVIIASLLHAGPAEKSGRLNIGDQIMTVNGTSLVGLPLSTCQSIIKGLKSQNRIKMNIVRCPPVTMVLIRRPDLRYQLGFSVQNGIICSLMRGGIAERGGVRVGHRIIEINSQSVVATAHERIVQILSNAMGEIHMKTMPAAMYRLLTAQEHPVYI